ncbi:MAG: helix-turn-helix domain-containing protein [Pseudomonadota bacterium]
MLDREKTILGAAFNVFARYGVKRATMNDIASEAGVARQTLYNAFANKEAILRALIQGHIEETCISLRDHMTSGRNLEAGLELAFDHFARKPYELIHKTPHGGEIMEALENSASEEMAESKRRFSEAMTMLLSSHVPQNAPVELSVNRLADFVVHTAMGHKAKAESQEHLEDLLATLKVIVLGTIDR